jgi:MtrB/PioB family decaheme-associated outer membrane protein
MTNVERGGGLLLLAGALALLASAGAVRAQSADSTLSGSGELGWRSFINRPNAQQLAKFEEYRDMGPGAVLQSLRLEYRPGDGRTRYGLTAAELFRRDQALAARSVRPGLFDLRLGWDRIPHTFSTDARLVAGAGTTSPFSLPSTLTRTLADTTAWRAAPFIGPVRTGWDVAQAVLTVTPDTHHDITADFTNIAKSGSRPMSMSLNATSLYREFLEPVDQNVRDLKLSESYARKRYQVQVAYDLNAFDNANASVSVTNPLLATSSPTAGSSVGRGALAPSNLAQTFTVAGGLNLPFRTRVNSTLSYGLRSQNEPFIPYTSNTALTDPRLATEPTSLNGDVHTLLANFTATTRPFRAVSLTARYRYWDFDDRTQVFTGKQMPLEVITDRSITGFADTTVVTERFPYRKQNAGLELRWSPIQPVGVQAGYAWERWNRAEGLEVATTNEYTPRVALDVSPADWISLRASVSHSGRRNNGYPDDAGNDNFAGFRRFNMADRDRNAGDLLAQLTATDRLAFSANYSVGRDAYPNSPYGVQSDRNSVLGGDVSYMVAPRLTVFASYTYELYRLGELNKYRDGTNPSNATFDYLIDERDLMQTGGLGLTGTLVPNRLDVEFRWDRSRGATLLQARNPLTPSATSASSISNATATDFPEIHHTWNPVHVTFRYDLNPNWSASLGFSHESWDSYDFRTAGLGALVYSSASPAAVSGVPLGNDLLPYTADYLTFSIGFRPHLSRAARPIL